jgi:hypothetical protein
VRTLVLRVLRVLLGDALEPSGEGSGEASTVADLPRARRPSTAIDTDFWPTPDAGGQNGQN